MVGSGKWQAALNGRNVDDDTRAAFDHPGHEGAVQTDSGEQVEVDLIEPSLIGECGESAAGSTRATEIVHKNVQASQILGDGFGSLRFQKTQLCSLSAFLLDFFPPPPPLFPCAALDGCEDLFGLE